MATLTEQQLNEVEARTGTRDLKRTQFNIQLPTGEIVPAGVNPGQAATIVLTGGRSPTAADVLDLSTPKGSAVAQAQPTTPSPAPTTPPPGTAMKEFTLPSGLKYQAPQSTVPYTPPPAQPVNIPGTGIPTSTLPNVATSTTSPYNPITSVNDLYKSAEFERLKTRIETDTAAAREGLATTGVTKILEDLFAKYKINDELATAQAYDAQILQEQKILRDLPDAIQKNLNGIGITQDTMTRLIARDMVQPTKALSDLMAQRGAAQDRINQALTFVNLFKDAYLKDQAAKIEANKFDLEQATGLYKDLEGRQMEFLSIALNERSKIMTETANAIQKGIPPEIAKAMSQAGSQAEALQIAAPYYAKLANEEFARKLAPGLAAQLTGNATADAALLQNSALQYGLPYQTLLDAVKGEKSAAANEYRKAYESARGTAAGKAAGEITTGTGAYIPGQNPAVDNWAKLIISGQASITQVPNPRGSTLRSDVVNAISSSGQLLLSDKDREKLGVLQNAKNVVQALKDLHSGLAPSSAFSRLFVGPLNYLAAKSQFSDIATAYDDARTGFVSNIARTLGEKGALSEGDITRAVANIPQLSDTKDVSDRKFGLLESILGKAGEAIIQTSTKPLNKFNTSARATGGGIKLRNLQTGATHPYAGTLTPEEAKAAGYEIMQ